MTKSVDFAVVDQDGEPFSAHEMEGRKWVMFFYPAALTPGCIIEAGDFRDRYQEFNEAGYEIVGISPDPPGANARFREVEKLPFRLLSDPDHEVASEFGAWGTKNSYGREYQGLIRSTFVIGEDGRVQREYLNVKARGHVGRVAQDLFGREAR